MVWRRRCPQFCPAGQDAFRQILEGFELPPRNRNSHDFSPQILPPPHRPVRPPQCGQVVAAERADRQQVSIVSEIAGTTTDPVEKPMETAADRAGAVHRHGRHRRRRGAGRNADAEDPAGLRPHRPGPGRRRRRAAGASSRKASSASCRARKIPAVVVFNKSDLATPPAGSAGRTRPRRRSRCVETVATEGRGVLELREALIAGRAGGVPQPAGDRGRPGAAGRDGRAGRAHRHGSPQGPADPAAGADDPRPAGRRRLLPGGQGARAARRAWTGSAARRPWW